MIRFLGGRDLFRLPRMPTIIYPKPSIKSAERKPELRLPRRNGKIKSLMPLKIYSIARLAQRGVDL
jgi:hypothetical protein